MDAEFLVPSLVHAQSLVPQFNQAANGIEGESQPERPSYIVDTRHHSPPTGPLPTSHEHVVLRRTVADYGLTGSELNRLAGSIRYMELLCGVRCQLWWLITDKCAARQKIAEIWKRITRLQSAEDLHPYSVTVFEGSGGLHANIVFVGNGKLARRLRSSTFGDTIQIKRVHDSEGLSQAYLAKERTPQAGYNRQFGGRLRGSHPLPGGGDRVRLSRGLERDAVESGFVYPWRHTNARRSEQREPYRTRCGLKEHQS